MTAKTVFIRRMACQDYLPIWQAMQTFSQQRTETTPDEIWVLEHNPVFTQGQNGKPEHILNPGDIPVIKVDRGGQVTYHGPGQCIVYPLIDLKRKKLNIREIVTLLENAVIDVLQEFNIEASAKKDAPGVYVNNAKICSVGLRIRRGCSYHGLAFNVAMDLSPFQRINPCGYVSLKMTQLSELGVNETVSSVGDKLIKYLIEKLRYNDAQELGPSP